MVKYNHIEGFVYLFKHCKDELLIKNKVKLLGFAARIDHVNFFRYLFPYLLEECGGCPSYKVKEVKDLCLKSIAKNGCPEIVKLLIESGTDFKTNDLHRETVLHYASRYGYSETVKLLPSDQWANIDAENNDGSTALHCAAGMGHTEIVQLLLNKRLTMKL